MAISGVKHLLGRRRKLGMGAMASLGLLLLGGCASSASGGGYIQSKDGLPGDHATFGFIYALNASSCSDTVDGIPAGSCNGKFLGQYTDTGAGVSFAGDYHGQPNATGEAGPYGPNCAVFTVNYRSTNSAKPGTGLVNITACDGGAPQAVPVGSVPSSNTPCPNAVQSEVLSNSNLGPASGTPRHFYSPDCISVNVTSGPYAGYSNGGDLSGGNLGAQ